jgi:hypothetical protein
MFARANATAALALPRRVRLTVIDASNRSGLAVPANPIAPPLPAERGRLEYLFKIGVRNQKPVHKRLRLSFEQVPAACSQMVSFEHARSTHGREIVDPCGDVWCIALQTGGQVFPAHLVSVPIRGGPFGLMAGGGAIPKASFFPHQAAPRPAGKVASLPCS